MRRAAASLPAGGAPRLARVTGYFQCHLVGFAPLEESTVFRDALARKLLPPAREDAEGAPLGRGGPMVLCGCRYAKWGCTSGDSWLRKRQEAYGVMYLDPVTAW